MGQMKFSRTDSPKKKQPKSQQPAVQDLLKENKILKRTIELRDAYIEELQQKLDDHHIL